MQPVKAAIAMVACAGYAAAQIAGTVRDSASGLPVAGVKITVTGGRSPMVESNGTGSFLLDAVPPGKYIVGFRRDGYQDGSAPVEVKPGGSTISLSIRPYAEIEGVVRGEDGKPLEGVNVYAGGLRDSTDQHGHYRARDIAAGQYTLTLRLPYELRQKTAIHDQARDQTMGYGYTLYYPGVPDARLATPITITPGARFTNFDIQLRRTPLVELRGKLTDAPDTAEVELDSPHGLPDGLYSKRKVDEHHGFRFEFLEPGDYSMAIHRNQPGDDLPYIAPIHLGETGVQDLEIVVPPFARIEGTVRGVREDLRWEGTVRVTLGRMGYESETRAGADGKFAWNAVPPGMWSLTVDTSTVYRAGEPTRKLYVSSSPPSSIPVAESGNPPLEIVLTDAAGHIRGTVDEPGLVTVSQTAGAVRTFRAAMPSRDGTFELEVAPGEYQVQLAGGPACAKQQEKVKVEAGGTANVHLKACGAAPEN